MTSKTLTPNSTLDDLQRHSFCVHESTLGTIVAQAFDAQPNLPGVLVTRGHQLLAVISRRRFLERLSQPYSLEIFMQRPIRVFLSIAMLPPPLVLSPTVPIEQAVQTALQRSAVELYEPIVIQGHRNPWELLDFQTLLVAENHLLFLQKEAIISQSQAIHGLNQELEWQANHDPLTQLLNRRAFEKRLQDSLKTINRSIPCHVLCYIDLDRFKTVNDTCGHGAGDELLRQVARLLCGGLNQTDTVSRIGGDEFAILLHGQTLDQALSIISAIQRSIQDLAFCWDHHLFRIGSSVGLYVLDDSLTDVTLALSAADAACYLAKNSTDHFYVYRSDDETLIQERSSHSHITALNQALADQRLCLYLQPIVKVPKVDDRPLSPRSLPSQPWPSTLDLDPRSPSP
ncbi:GGDEF domain-containing protein, partial [Prochlorothrix hollandica]|uniref:GGDEF domain-containing protein n=1 Tax=Prochlorothrix hollandica TaxID=1223 RepID=UPI00334252F7